MSQLTVVNAFITHILSLILIFVVGRCTWIP